MFRTFRSVLSLANTSLRIHPPSDTCVTELSFRFRIPERTHAVTEVVDVDGRVCLGVYTVSDAEKHSERLDDFRIVRYVGRSEALGLRGHLEKYSSTGVQRIPYNKQAASRPTSRPASRRVIYQPPAQWHPNNTAAKQKFDASLAAAGRHSLPALTDVGVVYVLLGDNGEVLYVGQTSKSSLQRAISHYTDAVLRCENGRPLSRVNVGVLQNRGPFTVVPIEKIPRSKGTLLAQFRRDAVLRERYYIGLLSPPLNTNLMGTTRQGCDIPPYSAFM